MITLKQAISADIIDKFVEQHTDDKGDKIAFNRTVEEMAGKSRAVQKTSSEASNDD